MRRGDVYEGSGLPGSIEELADLMLDVTPERWCKGAEWTDLFESMAAWYGRELAIVNWTAALRLNVRWRIENEQLEQRVVTS